MPRAAERITEDLKALEESAVAIAAEFHHAYEHYLNALAEAVGKQLTLASYHICTQGYPDAFLGLSSNQRRDLQRSLKQLVNQTQLQLRAQLHRPDGAEESIPSTPDDLDALLSDHPQVVQDPAVEPATPAEIKAAVPPPAPPSVPGEAAVIAPPISPTGIEAAGASSTSANNSEEQAETQAEMEAEAEVEEMPASKSIPAEQASEAAALLSELLAEATRAAKDAGALLPAIKAAALAAPTPTPLKGIQNLVQWQDNLEQTIAKILQMASRNANLLLHKAQLLPKQLPAPVLEAASKTEAAAESVMGPPNLLTLLVDTDPKKDKDSDRASVVQIMAVHLRLAEIELADPAAMAGRKRLRELQSQLKALQRENRKKQRELAVVEAEALWHRSWTESD